MLVPRLSGNMIDMDFEFSTEVVTLWPWPYHHYEPPGAVNHTHLYHCNLIHRCESCKTRERQILLSTQNRYSGERRRDKGQMAGAKNIRNNCSHAADHSSACRIMPNSKCYICSPTTDQLLSLICWVLHGDLYKSPHLPLPPPVSPITPVDNRSGTCPSCSYASTEVSASHVSNVNSFSSSSSSDLDELSEPTGVLHVHDHRTSHIVRNQRFWSDIVSNSASVSSGMDMDTDVYPNWSPTLNDPKDSNIGCASPIYEEDPAYLQDKTSHECRSSEWFSDSTRQWVFSSASAHTGLNYGYNHENACQMPKNSLGHAQLPGAHLSQQDYGAPEASPFRSRSAKRKRHYCNILPTVEKSSAEECSFDGSFNGRTESDRNSNHHSTARKYQLHNSSKVTVEYSNITGTTVTLLSGSKRPGVEFSSTCPTKISKSSALFEEAEEGMQNITLVGSIVPPPTASNDVLLFSEDQTDQVAVSTLGEESVLHVVQLETEQKVPGVEEIITGLRNLHSSTSAKDDSIVIKDLVTSADSEPKVTTLVVLSDEAKRVKGGSGKKEQECEKGDGKHEAGKRKGKNKKGRKKRAKAAKENELNASKSEEEARKVPTAETNQPATTAKNVHSATQACLISHFRKRELNPDVRMPRSIRQRALHACRVNLCTNSDSCPEQSDTEQDTLIPSDCCFCVDDAELDLAKKDTSDDYSINYGENRLVRKKKKKGKNGSRRTNDIACQTYH